MLIEGTTILCVRRNGATVMGGDGQVTLGSTVVKHGAKKIRRLGENSDVLAGFAGSTADAFALFERFEAKHKEYRGNLRRAAVEMAKEWRTDKYLRRLEAVLVIADRENTLMVTGMGDVIEPDHSAIAVGSGGNYALAAALALLDNSELDAEAIVTRAMAIASEICIYTNNRLQMEKL